MLVFRYISTQISTSAENKSSVVMLMPRAIIPMDHTFALVKLDTLGMAITVQVKPLKRFIALSVGCWVKNNI